MLSLERTGERMCSRCSSACGLAETAIPWDRRSGFPEARPRCAEGVAVAGAGPRDWVRCRGWAFPLPSALHCSWAACRRSSSPSLSPSA